MHQPTACLIIIGNEILSGRTQDTHLSWLAKELNEVGVKLAEARVIADDETTIVATVNTCRKLYDYIFTTGGIGPTHDDITSAAIAKAFGLPYERHKEAEAVLLKHYGNDKLNAPRLKMADMPRGAALVPNPVSGAPGFRVENVYVLAGVPSIMRVMFSYIKPSLKGGATVLSKTLSAYVTEGNLAEALSAIQDRYPEVAIGSYPFMRQQRLGTCLVARSTDADKLAQAAQSIKTMLLGLTQEVFEEDLAA